MSEKPPDISVSTGLLHKRKLPGRSEQRAVKFPDLVADRVPRRWERLPFIQPHRSFLTDAAPLAIFVCHAYQISLLNSGIAPTIRKPIKDERHSHPRPLCATHHCGAAILCVRHDRLGDVDKPRIGHYLIHQPRFGKLGRAFLGLPSTNGFLGRPQLLGSQMKTHLDLPIQCRSCWSVGFLNIQFHFHDRKLQVAALKRVPSHLMKSVFGIKGFGIERSTQLDRAIVILAGEFDGMT